MQNSDFFFDLQQKIVLESDTVDGATPNCRLLPTIDGANHTHLQTIVHNSVPLSFVRW